MRAKVFFQGFVGYYTGVQVRMVRFAWFSCGWAVLRFMPALNASATSSCGSGSTAQHHMSSSPNPCPLSAWPGALPPDAAAVSRELRCRLQHSQAAVKKLEGEREALLTEVQGMRRRDRLAELYRRQVRRVGGGRQGAGVRTRERVVVVGGLGGAHKCCHVRTSWAQMQRSCAQLSKEALPHTIPKSTPPLLLPWGVLAGGGPASAQPRPAAAAPLQGAAAGGAVPGGRPQRGQGGHYGGGAGGSTAAGQGDRGGERRPAGEWALLQWSGKRALSLLDHMLGTSSASLLAGFPSAWAPPAAAPAAAAACCSQCCCHARPAALCWPSSQALIFIFLNTFIAGHGGEPAQAGAPAAGYAEQGPGAAAHAGQGMTLAAAAPAMRGDHGT